MKKYQHGMTKRHLQPEQGQAAASEPCGTLLPWLSSQPTLPVSDPSIAVGEHEARCVAAA